MKLIKVFMKLIDEINFLKNRELGTDSNVHPMFRHLKYSFSKEVLYTNYIHPLTKKINSERYKKYYIKYQKYKKLNIELNIERIKFQRLWFDQSDGVSNPNYYYTGLEKIDEKIEKIKKGLPDHIIRELDELHGRIAQIKKFSLTFREDKGNETLNYILEEAANKPNDYPFVTLYQDRQDASDGNCIETIILQTSQTINIPLSYFSSADSFHNWYGRPPKRLKDNRDSFEVIKDYANRPPSEVPTVKRIEIYIYKNGEVFINSNNSHRVAAMIHRGDRTIQFQGEYQLYLVDRFEPDYPNYEEQSLQARNNSQAI